MLDAALTAVLIGAFLLVAGFSGFVVQRLFRGTADPSRTSQRKVG